MKTSINAPFTIGQIILLLAGAAAGIFVVEGLRAIGIMPPSNAVSVREDDWLAVGALLGSASVAFWVWRRK